MFLSDGRLDKLFNKTIHFEILSKLNAKKKLGIEHSHLPTSPLRNDWPCLVTRIPSAPGIYMCFEDCSLISSVEIV